MSEELVTIITPYIELGQLLKLAGMTATGGQAKVFLESETVMVNGLRDLRRGRKLYPGDRVVAQARLFLIAGSVTDVRKQP